MQLKTLGHATVVILDGDRPLLATDPWLAGSAYWSSWWLEREPDDHERDLVAQAGNLYITHSHPDHFHFPSLCQLGPRQVLHPQFSKYRAPLFLEKLGFSTSVLEPWYWYQLSDSVKIASIPVPIDDSMLVIDTPGTTVINVNDAHPGRSLLDSIRRRMCTPSKPVIVLKSYAPASSAVATFKHGRRSPLKSKQDYVRAAERLARQLDAQGFVPFASQAFFGRSDSDWANEHKVAYEDLCQYWVDSKIVLYPPFVTLDLQSLEYSSDYEEANHTLGQTQRLEVATREAEEATFGLPADFDDRLKHYLDDIYFLRILFPRGIGFRLTSSGSERFYNSRTRQIQRTIPPRVDFTMSVPDRVLSEALMAGVLTDLGISMFIRVDTNTSLRLTYAAYLLMGLHDYGHFDDPASFLRFIRYYFPYLFPGLLAPGRGRESRPPRSVPSPTGPDCRRSTGTS